MRVVSGLLARSDGRVLMGLRRPEKLRPNLWELPGGKVEEGESDEEALRREWFEELGVLIEVIGAPIVESHMNFDVEIDLVLYRVEVKSGQPRAIDHAELMWCYPSKGILHWPCSPGFYVQYKAIQAASGEVLP